jgi:hypothetical protein
MEVQGGFVTGTVTDAAGTISLPVGYNAVDTGFIGLGHLGSFGNMDTHSNEDSALVYNNLTSVKTSIINLTVHIAHNTQESFFFTVPIQGWDNF